MFVILMTAIAIVNCLESKDDQTIPDEIKTVINKYMNKIPDVPPQYVIHEGLSKVISRYFKEKISTFPLYRISLKLDRNPVRIPWSLVDSNALNISDTDIKDEAKAKVKTYKFMPNPNAKKE